MTDSGTNGGAPAFLADGGAMGALMREHDWSTSPLGAPEGWPDALKMSVSICLNSRFPIVLWWGPEFVMLYNDAWRPVLGESKHPGGLGRPGIESWGEIWDVIGAQFAEVMGGEASWSEDLLLVLDRYGYNEEAYFTYSYSPIKDADGSIQGVFSAVNETTERVLGTRRLGILGQLTARALDADSVTKACQRFADVLGHNHPDLPFAALYLADGMVARRMAVAGLADDEILPREVALDGGDDPWSIAAVISDGRAVLVDALDKGFASLPGGAWPEPTTAALVLPVTKAGEQVETTGVLVAGLNRRRALDDAYRNFLALVAGNMATAVANARAYEGERKRAESLAEIDRAKTAFFSNVSHEFRTPLTLMLGPIEDAMADTEGLGDAQRERLDIAHRNALRLLRLVNSLLDFSRIEAGRVEALYRPTDLAALTAELASSFRSATDRAGLTLIVDAEPLSGPVYVDSDMWEKIVLNLLSNAFKFTFDGTIEVRLTERRGHVQLVVKDSGTGIPASELPKLFDRFHRVEGASGRSFEGSGIGLALVQELVKLHNGDVAVESELGLGTTFTVTLPLGSAHLPAQQLTDDVDKPRPERSEAFVQEALRWLTDAPSVGRSSSRGTGADGAGFGDAAKPRRVLLADDNADLRDYIARLLGEQGFVVETAIDGAAALAAAQSTKPDLLITDVMMPRLDGFGLLREVRGDPALRDLPVILLSARAGEEAKVEGLDAGADDYLVKPFSARELVARVSANITMAQIRRDAAAALRETEERYRLAARATNDAIWDWNLATDHVLWNDALGAAYGHAPADVVPTGAWWIAHIHPDDRAKIDASVHAAIDGAAESWTDEYRFARADGSYADVLDRGHILRGTEGRATRMIGAMLDLTDRRRAEAALRDLNETLERRVAQAIGARERAEEALRQAQKMEAVGQLTGGIAHDFNNLLTIITGNVDMARRGLVAGETSRATRAMDNAQKGAERAAALTQRLLAFSRRQPLAPKPINVDRLVAGMSDLLNRSLGETMQLEVVTAPGLWRIEADPNQLENAILNLAVNARDAMPTGGVLTIETANARLDEGYAAANAEVAPGNYVVVAVTDTGHGMSRETVARVFDPFFTTKEVGKGTGLGLSMVYGFVKQSGGHVKVYSEEGQGTTIKIYLPRLLSEGEIVEEQPVVTVDHVRRERTILVVEDDDDVRAYTVECLRELGYRVLEAHDGPAALRLVERQDQGIDLLFTDVVMPMMSGRELADKAREVRPDLKVLYTSGYTRNAIVHGGRLDAGVEMIAKPFTYQALAEKIADSLDIGSTGRVLVVEDDATVRMFAAEALEIAGYAVDEAATANEALNRVRANQGRYDAVILDVHLPDKGGDALAVELRASYADLPLLLASGEHDAEMRDRFGADRCTGVIGKPYNAAKLHAALGALGVRCAVNVAGSS